MHFRTNFNGIGTAKMTRTQPYCVSILRELGAQSSEGFSMEFAAYTLQLIRSVCLLNNCSTVKIFLIHSKHIRSVLLSEPIAFVFRSLSFRIFDVRTWACCWNLMNLRPNLLLKYLVRYSHWFQLPNIASYDVDFDEFVLLSFCCL